MSRLGVHILGEVCSGSRGVSDSALRRQNWRKQFSLPSRLQCVICATALAWQIGKCRREIGFTLRAQCACFSTQ